MITSNRRPGVYSQYDVSSLYATARSRKYAGVVARAGSATGETLTLRGYNQAREAFGRPEDERLLGALRVLFSCGVAGVIVRAVAAAEVYGEALAAAAAWQEVGALLCDCAENDDRKLLAASVREASRDLRERIGVCGAGETEAALAAAAALCDERMVVCTPAGLPMGVAGAPDPFYTAAAVAGTVLAANDPAHNFSGLPLTCLQAPERLCEEAVQRLLAGGVTLVEPVGEQVQIVRALTTRTVEAGAPDSSLSGLNAILIIDDVMASVRGALGARLRGSRISAQSRDSILAQVIVELAAKRDEGLLEEFDTPVVYPHGEDATVCVVELSFRVAHVLHQIHVTAHIQV